MGNLEELKAVLRKGGMAEEGIQAFLEDPECYEVLQSMVNVTQGMEEYIAQKGICECLDRLPRMQEEADICRGAYKGPGIEGRVSGGTGVSWEDPVIREALKEGRSYRDIWREKRIFRGVSIEEMFFTAGEMDILLSLWESAVLETEKEIRSPTSPLTESEKDVYWKDYARGYAEVRVYFEAECYRWVHEVFPQYKEDPSSLVELRKTAPKPEDFYDP